MTISFEGSPCLPPYLPSNCSVENALWHLLFQQLLLRHRKIKSLNGNVIEDARGAPRFHKTQATIHLDAGRIEGPIRQAAKGIPLMSSDLETVSVDPKSGHDAARFFASISLSLGALMLSLFGIVQHLSGFEKLGTEGGLAILALLPGIATLAFLACARAISWMISTLTFAQWRGVVPTHRWTEFQRLIEGSNQFHFRLTLMSGAYLLFSLVITALASTSAGLAFGLCAPEFGVNTLPLALTAGGATALLVLHEMLTRDGQLKTILTAVYAATLISTMVADVVLSPILSG
jgi:hypothetical protein